jgi:PII-like signaling protein
VSQPIDHDLSQGQEFFFQFEKYLAKHKIHTDKIMILNLDIGVTTAVIELNSGIAEVCTHTYRLLHFIKSLTCHTVISIHALFHTYVYF